MRQLSLPAFQAALRTRFRLPRQSGSNIELLLVEARVVGTKLAGGECRSFSILFHGPADPLLPQQTYSLEHDVLGTFDLFIVPVGRDINGCRYEAVFNQ